MSAILVLSTASSMTEARKIAKLLLDQKLAACVNLVPQVESHYKWKEKHEKAEEVLLLIKTQKKLFGALEQKIRSCHSYDVPEIISCDISDGSPPYLAWLQRETSL